VVPGVLITPGDSVSDVRVGHRPWHIAVIVLTWVVADDSNQQPVNVVLQAGCRAFGPRHTANPQQALRIGSDPAPVEDPV
jgi:hypothetical protein